jgi:hypothetical protein
METMKRLFLTSVAALFLATGTAHADEGCDTQHTSDLRGLWRCGDVCINRYGNQGDRMFQIYGARDKAKSGIKDAVTFVFKSYTVTMNGKQCKPLEQTYDYEKLK